MPAASRYTPEFFRKAVVPYAVALCQHEDLEAVEVRYLLDVNVWEHVRPGVRSHHKLFATISKDGAITPGPRWEATFDTKE